MKGRTNKLAWILLLGIIAGFALLFLPGRPRAGNPVPPGSPPQAPRPGGRASDGEPVDCYTGLFVHTETDLVLRDVIPIALTRTYRQGDSTLRAFGIGASDNYDIYLTGNTSPYTFIV